MQPEIELLGITSFLFCFCYCFFFLGGGGSGGLCGLEFISKNLIQYYLFCVTTFVEAVAYSWNLLNEQPIAVLSSFGSYHCY